MEGKRHNARSFGDIKIMERRISYLIGARLKNSNQIERALKKQDEIRKRHPAPKDWDSASEVRRWRKRE